MRKTGRRTGRNKLRVGSPDPEYTVKRKSLKEVENLALSGQLTSAATKLIVPDEQLLRLGYERDHESLSDTATKLIIPTPGSSDILIPQLRGRLFFFDEANVSWCPETGRIYRVVGQPYKVDTPGKNQTKYILGSLEYPSGNGLYEIYPHKTHKEVQAHLEHLLDMFPEFLFVVRDNASQHVTPKLDKFLIDNKDRLCLVPLPTYSPHLNLIERLWHYMRDNITRSHFYTSLKLKCEALVAWFETLPFERFFSLMGLSP